MRTIAVVGAVVTVLRVYRLPIQQLDLRYPFLVLVTLVIGSRITVQIPRAKGTSPSLIHLRRNTFTNMVTKCGPNPDEAETVEQVRPAPTRPGTRINPSER